METDCRFVQIKDSPYREWYVVTAPHHAIKWMVSCCAAWEIMTKTLYTAGNMKVLAPKDLQGN